MAGLAEQCEFSPRFVRLINSETRRRCFEKVSISYGSGRAGQVSQEPLVTMMRIYNKALLLNVPEDVFSEY